MRSRKARPLTAQEKRALASAGLVVTRYDTGGERATVQQLTPESDERRRSFARRLGDNRKAREGD